MPAILSRTARWRSLAIATASGLALMLPLAATAQAAGSSASMPSVRFVSPRPNQTVVTTAIHIHLAVKNFDLECKYVGQKSVPGRGHIHIMVDGTDMAHLINMYCSTNITIPGQGLAPGKHTIIAVLAGDMHNMVSKPAMLTINYEPKVAPSALPAPRATGAPTIHILYPRQGATVGPRFDLKVNWTNFTPSCRLEGKADVAGYGHIHVFVDPNMKAMMAGNMSAALSGLLGMPCSHVIRVNLSGWSAGKHTIMVMLVNNDHTPVMPLVDAMVTVTLK